MTILGLQHRGEFCIQISMSIEQNIHKTCIGMHRGGKKALKFEYSEIFYFICMPYGFWILICITHYLFINHLFANPII